MTDVDVSYSLKTLEAERDELHKDLQAFAGAYSLIHRRLLESLEESPDRGQSLEKWSGTWACAGSLELATQTIEKKIQALEILISGVRCGELRNLDDTPKRGLSIVKEDKN